MRKNSNNSTGRKKGGQPGNKNALRHGFYSELYSTDDSRRLDHEFDLFDDMKAMRIKAFHLFRLTPLEKFNKRELMTFDRFLNAIISINTLERTRLLARGHGGQIGDDILTALKELNPDEDLE